MSHHTFSLSLPKDSMSLWFLPPPAQPAFPIVQILGDPDLQSWRLTLPVAQLLSYPHNIQRWLLRYNITNLLRLQTSNLKSCGYLCFINTCVYAFSTPRISPPGMKPNLLSPFWETAMLQYRFLSCSIHTILVRESGSVGSLMCGRQNVIEWLPVPSIKIY